MLTDFTQKIVVMVALAMLVSAPLNASQDKGAPLDPHEKYKRFFQEQALPLKDTKHLKPLYQAMNEQRFVLLGESTHGTREYYQWRAKISTHLIGEQDFSFVALEGDWQAIYRLNNYVKLRTPDDLDTRTLMHSQLTRWPQWMWANEEFAEFIDWLREHNRDLPEGERVGVFGLDMQDPEDSMDAVLNWFAQHDKENHAKVLEIYQKIRDFPESFRGYAQHLVRGGERLDEILALPTELLEARLGRKPDVADKTLWAAWQNALAVQAAEAQFHGATTRGPESWNARARHMHKTLLHVADRHGADSRGLVWAHNTHVGDATATDMARRGEVNIGQLLRASHGVDDVFILGFGTNQGEVIAGPAWGAKPQKVKVVPAQAGSFESLMHKSDLEQALLLFGEQAQDGILDRTLPQRAIGVVYRPPHEAYVPTRLAHRYDAFIYFDTTAAVSPLSEGVGKAN